MKEALTPAQQKVLDWVKVFIATKSYPPTRVEIGKALGFGGNAAKCHLLAIERRGWIVMEPKIARGLRVLP